MRRTLALLLILLILPCAASAFTDSRSAEVGEQVPERVVCLYGSYAEAWLQASGSLVGVTEDAVSERALALSPDVQIIGTTKAPNLELILALNPDLVILSADIAAQVSAAQTLEAAGVRCAAFRVDTVQEYASMMAVFTQLTVRPDLYEQEIPPMLAQIDGLIADARAQRAPSVLLLRAYSTGVKAKGADNLAGVMLEDLGCDNIASRVPSLLEELTLESIVAADPDCIFISVMGSDEDAALAALDASWGQNPAWQALRAVAEGRVYVLPKDLFHYKPNARWGESYAYLYNLLFESAGS